MFEQDWVSQSVGGCAFAVSVGAYATKSDRHMKMMIALGTMIFTIQYAYLGAWVVALNLLMNSARSWLSMHRQGVLWFLLIAALQIAVSLTHISTEKDWFPVLGSVMGSFALLCLSGVRMRLAMLVTTLLWLANNLIWGSVGGVLLDCINLFCNLLSIHTIWRSRATDIV